MASLSERILQYLDENDTATTLELAKKFNEDHQKIIGAVKSIQAVGDLISAEPQNEKSLELTEEGRNITEKGNLIIYFQINDCIIPILQEVMKLLCIMQSLKKGFRKKS